MNVTETPELHVRPKEIPAALESARAACRRMAPLWPLQHFVAVNPFVGLADLPFIEACALLRRMVPGGMQMPADFYRQKYDSGEILEGDLDWALAQSREAFSQEGANRRATVARDLLWSGDLFSREVEVLTVSEMADRAQGSAWTVRITEAIGQFCAAYFDAGQSAWRFPWRDLPLFAAWRESASLDATPELQGWKGFRTRVKALPPDAGAAIIRSLSQLGVAEEDATDFMHKQLLSIRGWAGYVQYRVRENSLHDRSDDALLQLLAIRLAYDAALLEQMDSPTVRQAWSRRASGPEVNANEVRSLFIWQLAYEHAWQRELFGKLRAARTTPRSPRERPAVQAVFCIDVRSEILRRALEAASPAIDTIGFAGFFGLPIEYIPLGQRHGASLCPVLLTPRFRVREALRAAGPEQVERELRRQRLDKRLSYSWNSFKTSAISCFSFVETAGLAFGAQLFRDGFAPSDGNRVHRHMTCGPQLEKDHSTGIGPADRVQLALGMLRNMGVTTNFARIVLLCGHGSETVNNPYGSGLDCGACGGNAGDANARVGAAILNDPPVRAALIDEGIDIPNDTHFVAGLHNTTTDHVTLFDLDEAPVTHQADLVALQKLLEAAARAARRERAPLLGLDQGHPRLDHAITAKSRDWAQVRPEWGLAGNAAFVAAPRMRTREANLGGRVFLHEYDHRTDTRDATLELIMVAPMVVANWINLQYYASTVNNAVFGSGNKVIHNVVGTFGVCLGNGGDLQTGLPLESLHDGKKWIHEPLRLHVLIEAPRERIAALLAKHEGVRQLVDHGWLLLFAIEDEGASFYSYQQGNGWEKID